MLTIENKFGKQCVMNGNLLKGILLNGETLEEFTQRMNKPRIKPSKISKPKKIPKYHVKSPYGTEDKSLIGTVTII
jgi:hypothetical protein